MSPRAGSLWGMTPKNTFKKYKATCAVGFGYGNTPKQALADLLYHNPSVHPRTVVVKGLTVQKSEHETWYAYDRVVELELPATKRVFACISDENGILMYAGRHVDLPDALVSYARVVGWSETSLRKNPDDLEDLALGHAWYEFNVPPEDWEDWTGDMGPDEYDALCEAADYIHRHADEAVDEALARLERGKQ